MSTTIGIIITLFFLAHAYLSLESIVLTLKGRKRLREMKKREEELIRNGETI